MVEVEPKVTVPVWVALHADLVDVPRLAAARELLAEALAEEAPRLAGLSPTSVSPGG